MYTKEIKYNKKIKMPNISSEKPMYNFFSTDDELGINAYFLREELWKLGISLSERTLAWHA